MAIKNMTLEEFLEFLKEQQGDQSLRSFAQNIGVSPSYLSRVYSGDLEPGVGITSAVKTTRNAVYSVETTEEEKKK